MRTPVRLVAARLLLSSLVCTAFGACTSAPRPRPAPEKPPEPGPAAAARPADEGVHLEYRPHAQGRTLIEVAEPHGARVQIFDGSTVVAQDDAPVSFEAVSDKYYRVVARLQSGALRERKLQARLGEVGSLRFEDSGVSGPVALSDTEFKRLRRALDLEGSAQGKLSVLRTAASNAWFTTAQAGKLIDALVYRENKLESVPILKDRILDRQNAYQLYQRFTYREDKEKVRELLEK